MSNRELAHDLKVDERTVRAWTKGREGYATPPIGVTEELTAALDAEIEAARAHRPWEESGHRHLSSLHYP